MALASAGRFVCRRQRALRRSRLRLFSFLPMIALALASDVRVAAQATPFTPGFFQSLYTAVESRGFNVHTPPQFVAPLGMQVKDVLPCRVVIGGGGHSIFSIQYQSRQYLIVRLTRGTDRWQYLVNDVGNVVGCIARKGSRWFAYSLLVSPHLLRSSARCYW